MMLQTLIADMKMHGDYHFNFLQYLINNIRKFLKFDITQGTLSTNNCSNAIQLVKMIHDFISLQLETTEQVLERFSETVGGRF